MIRVAVRPDLIRWARERSGIPRESLAARFKKLPEWEDGVTQPTLKQVEAFARAVHVPVGYLFLTEPPEEDVPIPDFRTFPGHEESATGKDALLVRSEGRRRVQGYLLTEAETPAPTAVTEEVSAVRATCADSAQVPVSAGSPEESSVPR